MIWIGRLHSTFLATRVNLKNLQKNLVLVFLATEIFHFVQVSRKCRLSFELFLYVHLITIENSCYSGRKGTWKRISAESERFRYLKTSPRDARTQPDAPGFRNSRKTILDVNLGHRSNNNWARFFFSDTEIVKIEKQCSTIIAQKSRDVKKYREFVTQSTRNTQRWDFFHIATKEIWDCTNTTECAKLENLWRSSFFSRLSST